MSMLPFFLRAAMRSLARGGQRVLVALLCIAFGVMSMVAMTLLSEALEKMLVIAPANLVGGDVTADRMVEDAILPEHIADLDRLRQTGQLDRYSLIAFNSSLTYKFPGSGELQFPSAGLGIDPATYPLAGSFTISLPAGGRAAELFERPGDVLVTRDLVDEAGLRLGGELTLSDLSTGRVVPGRVVGIVSDTPNHQGDKFYYSHETALALTGGKPAVNTVLANSSDPAGLAAEMFERGWRSLAAVDMALADEQTQSLFELAFKGSGVLGMLVGGIGVANTMQVLLRRRRRDVAVFKCLGYRQNQLLMMFALEAGLLGLTGSLLGAALGIGLSYLLVDMFTRITTLLIQWSFSPLPVLYGVLIGLVTTVSFAMFAIVVASQETPLSLLRRETMRPARVPGLRSLGLAVLCGLPFAAATAAVMESVVKGLAVLLGAVAGLAVLGGLLAGMVWLVTRLLPLRGLPLLHMARNNLRRRGATLVFAMVALYVGVLSLSFGVVVTGSATRALDERNVELSGDNITILAPAEHEQAIRQAAAEQIPDAKLISGFQTAVRSITINREESNPIAPVLIGRGETPGFQVSGAPWGSRPDGVYVFGMDGEDLAGYEVKITLEDGSSVTLPVVGTYAVNFDGVSIRPRLGLLLSKDLSASLAEPEMVQAWLRAPTGQVNRVSAALGSALPDAVVINLPAYAARFTQIFRNLFIFAAALAGLALLAGLLLLANSVSLAMLDRRYEIGVLKSIGYARWQILQTLVVEYGLVALIACGAGLLSMEIALLVGSLLNALAGSLLVMTLPDAGLILLGSVGLTLLVVFGVTWRPMQASPVVVLNDRE